MWFNPIMAGVLRSPLHGLLSQSFMLIRVTGRKSGRIISTPVNYVRDGSALIVTSQRQRKWWRNLAGGAPVSVLVAGRELHAHGTVIVDEQAVASCLTALLQKVPNYAKYYRVALDSSGRPMRADCERAALGRVMVRIDLS